MRPYRWLVDSLSSSRVFAWLGRHVISPLDRRFGARFPLTSGLDVDSLQLTTTGRRSGQPRTAMLLNATDAGGRRIVAATNYGAETPPAWSLNLDADPHALVSPVGGEPYAAVARRASREETPELWRRLDAVWPAFPTYRKRAGRDIPVYVLEPET